MAEGGLYPWQDCDVARKRHLSRRCSTISWTSTPENRFAAGWNADSAITLEMRCVTSGSFLLTTQPKNVPTDVQVFNYRLIVTNAVAAVPEPRPGRCYRWLRDDRSGSAAAFISPRRCLARRSLRDSTPPRRAPHACARRGGAASACPDAGRQTSPARRDRSDRPPGRQWS